MEYMIISSLKGTAHSCATPRFGLGMRRAEPLKAYASHGKRTGRVAVLYCCIRSLTQWCQWRVLGLGASRSRVSIQEQRLGVPLPARDADIAEHAMTGHTTESLDSVAILSTSPMNHLPGDLDEHMFEFGKCRQAAVPSRCYAPRVGHQPREPARPSHSDPTVGLPGRA